MIRKSWLILPSMSCMLVAELNILVQFANLKQWHAILSDFAPSVLCDLIIF